MKALTEKRPKFGPGTLFKTRGKYPKVCTVTDVYTTRNLAGQIVAIRYVATHDFMGQTVTEYDIPDTTISMGLLVAK